LRDLISSLPTGFRSVFNLYAVEGYSHKEIGDMLEIAESTSRSQFARARAILQQKMQELYGYSQK
jgi:RNA polymerase sigma factor (sigma-70 family)